MPDELKPCPFCGGEVLMTYDEYGNPYATCRACDARADDGDTRDQAIAAWNRRTP